MMESKVEEEMITLLRIDKRRGVSRKIREMSRSLYVILIEAGLRLLAETP